MYYSENEWLFLECYTNTSRSIFAGTPMLRPNWKEPAFPQYNMIMG